MATAGEAREFIRFWESSAHLLRLARPCPALSDIVGVDNPMMKTTRPFHFGLGLLLLATGVASSAMCAAQGRTLRHVHAKGSLAFDLRYHEAREIVCKLVERETRDAATRAEDLAALEATLGRRLVRSYFAGLEAELDGIEERIRASGTEDLGADLRRYFIVETRDVADTRAMLAALNALPLVELAYPRERPTPPPGDLAPLTPSFVSQQRYRGPAPGGFDAFAASTVAGATGSGLTVLDIEWSWQFEHEDLAVLRATSLVGPPHNGSYANHGAAVVGELAGDDDAWGVSGLTSDIKLRVASDYPAGQNYSVARAIVTGLPVLKKGDVMLLEAQTNTPLGLGPTEWNQADFDAIVVATKAGVIVVEAGGNGGVNLDSPTLGGRFDLTKADSGALIVGASVNSSLNRAGFSAYGSRIDANGWGDSIVTSGYGDLFDPTRDLKQDYTASFGGTSGASPMVTSTIVMLLASARAQLSAVDADSFVDHRQLRGLLRKYGTAMNANQGIGLRPDMRALLEATGLLRGIEVSNEPKIGASFGIVVKADFAATPQDAWMLLFAPALGNIEIPTLQAPCNRLLVDLATLYPAGTGIFATGNKSTFTVQVPNDTSLEYATFYWQALTLDTAKSRACLSSAVRTRVRK